jgi:hypothetical protein
MAQKVLVLFVGIVFGIYIASQAPDTGTQTATDTQGETAKPKDRSEEAKPKDRTPGGRVEPAIGDADLPHSRRLVLSAEDIPRNESELQGGSGLFRCQARHHRLAR